MTHFVAGVTAALHGMVALERLAVAQAAEVHLPGLHMLDVVGARVHRAADVTNPLPIFDTGGNFYF
jgi:hypothetical protein